MNQLNVDLAMALAREREAQRRLQQAAAVRPRAARPHSALATAAFLRRVAAAARLLRPRRRTAG